MLRVDRAECRETGLDELISGANIDFEFDFQNYIFILLHINLHKIIHIIVIYNN